MGWTDERVENLKKLWQDGLSASHIATQLGGVTRNAVIGKVHRLGLTSRAQPSIPVSPELESPRSNQAQAKPAAPRRIAEPVVMDGVSEPVPTPVRYADEMPGSATIHTLDAHMCKWPIGDEFCCQMKLSSK